MPATLNRLISLVWIPLLSLLLAAGLSLTPLFERLDALSLDTQARLVAQPHYFKDAIVIDIDDASLRELQAYFGAWPYRRDTYAKLIDFLGEQGAHVIVMDLVFADAREGDAQLRAALGRGRNVVLAATAYSEPDSNAHSQAAMAGLTWPVPAGLPSREWPGLQLPLPAFTQPAPDYARIGIASVLADSDGVLRHLPLFHRLGNQTLPSLPLAAHFMDSAPPPIAINPDGTTRIGALNLPTDRHGAIRLNFPRNRNSVLTISFADVARALLGVPGQQLSNDLFRGKTVFVGSTALFADRVLTPVGEMMGVHVLAIAHQSLAENLIITPNDWRWTGALMLIALAPSLLLLRRQSFSVRVLARDSLAAVLLIYAAHLALLYWHMQETSLLLPLLLLGIANLLAAAQVVRLRHDAQEAEIHDLVNDDPQTRLPNRQAALKLLAEAIEQAQARGNTLAVLIISLNNFRIIRSALGHGAGDQMVIEAAQRLRTYASNKDIIARLGEDEFLVAHRLTAGDATDDGHDYANLILGSFTRPYDLFKLELHASANVGISLFPANGQDVTTLLKQADSALRSAKVQGRNTCRSFTEDMGLGDVAQLLLENQLRQALTRDELLLHYQPQIDMASQRIVAVEALVRWKHPVHGLLAPDRFIPAAEHSELFAPLGEWVLRAACRQMRAWQHAGLTHIERVAVNLSAQQFDQPDLPALVASVLQETQLGAQHLELEITESMAMRNPERSITVLRDLLAMGITLALDDFGTGYSSLSYLKLLPVTRIKIDRSFVSNVENDPHDAEICAATIDLAHKLGLTVTAEGIETPGQFAYLRGLACNEAQGYLICRPLPADQVEQFEPAGMAVAG
ncbi:EAL domain-containing protein [Uliginosibacterium sp. H3]|uniref:EAL domain-containing protein n=1 Tax=Uliginosibacterium silvisoli TaxID=3114758 RepID=A0ABU6K4M8_9RHOO|nr:EAL domain-containing protein [Uliginosibacterium sp. H3]